MSMLTLTFDDKLASQAQEYARRTGTDMSVLVAELLRPVVATPVSTKSLPLELAALYGCISLPPGFDYKEELGKALTEKYQ